MYKYIVLCLCVSLGGVLCIWLNKEEGHACELDGVKGKCVKQTQCLSTLDWDINDHICSEKDDDYIVCCTDCELVNDTRNVVLSPTGGVYWKDGTSKARDNCLKYLNVGYNNHRCEVARKSYGVHKKFDDEKKCHTILAFGSAPLINNLPSYTHKALLGYGDDLASAEWLAGGSIISEKFILTAAHVNSYATQVGDLKFIKLGDKSPTTKQWNTREVKRFIPHPDYKAPSRYNDIALIEVEERISFHRVVQPACLHVEEANAKTAITTTWRDLESKSYTEMSDTIQTIHLDEFTEEECKTAYNYRPNRTLKDGINYTTQMCYGSKSHSPEACKGLSGEPLLIDTQFSYCVYTIIGVTSFGTSHCGPHTSTPDVYTRVAHYTPWIESVVWA